MKIKTIFCLLLFCSSLQATLIKGRAKVYTMDTHRPFAILYDSTLVSQSSDWRRKVAIELHCFVLKSDYQNGKLVNREIMVDYDGKGEKKWPTNEIFMTDTVYLYSDEALQNKIGYAWPANDSVSISFDDMESNPNYLRCWLYGHVDSSSILQFEPWNKIIIDLAKNNNLFNIEYGKLRARMLAVHSDFNPSSVEGNLLYSSTYDEESPEPGTPLIYVFQNGRLRALWAEIKLNIKNKEKYHGGFLYYDDSIRSNLLKIKKQIKTQLDYRP